MNKYKPRNTEELLVALLAESKTFLPIETTIADYVLGKSAEFIFAPYVSTVDKVAYQFDHLGITYKLTIQVIDNVDHTCVRLCDGECLSIPGSNLRVYNPYNSKFSPKFPKGEASKDRLLQYLHNWEEHIAKSLKTKRRKQERQNIS